MRKNPAPHKKPVPATATTGGDKSSAENMDVDKDQQKDAAAKKKGSKVSFSNHSIRKL